MTTPTSFVSLDPAIEGPGDVLEDGASVAVSRERRPVKARRTRPATGAEPTAPADAGRAPNGDAAAPARDRGAGTEDHRGADGARSLLRRARSGGGRGTHGADVAASEDPITAEIPIITADNGVGAASPA